MIHISKAGTRFHNPPFDEPKPKPKPRPTPTPKPQRNTASEQERLGVLRTQLIELRKQPVPEHPRLKQQHKAKIANMERSIAALQAQIQKKRSGP